MKNPKPMPNPGFYCVNFIEYHGCLPKFQPKPCLEQCHKCMDEVIDHHFNKAERAKLSGGKTGEEGM